MNCRINPNPRLPQLIFVNDADAVRKRIRKEWIWYRMVTRVLWNKPKLRNIAEKEMEKLKVEYESIRQSTPPPCRK